MHAAYDHWQQRELQALHVWARSTCSSVRIGCSIPFIHSFIVSLITPLDKTQWTTRRNTNMRMMRHGVSKIT